MHRLIQIFHHYLYLFQYFYNHIAKIENHKGIIKLTWSNKNKESKFDINYTFKGNMIIIDSTYGSITVDLNKKAELNTAKDYSLVEFSKSIVNIVDDNIFDFAYSFNYKTQSKIKTPVTFIVKLFDHF